ncbi:MAG TPA: tetratricopeptide repeat protein [Candidatus Acidoferrales bacterium]|nr:tetratricopeptide repeat protein [Candidatus Acidoferrales bacterium]
MRLPGTILAAACVAALVWPGAARAQSSSSQDSSSQESSSSSKPAQKNKGQGPQPAPPAAPDGSDKISRRINNSAPAQHDVEVGQYYMKKEKYDAAIDRFKDAAHLLPDYADAYRLMGEAYEKKKFLPEAMAAYQKFIEVAPKDKDAEDMRKRVARLQSEIQEEDRRRAAATKP